VKSLELPFDDRQHARRALADRGAGVH
jgi:hypothetical protein